MESGLEPHLEELRSRALHSLLVLAVVSAACFYFSPRAIELLQSDLGLRLNALVAYEVFYTRLMVAVLLGSFLSLPVFLLQFLGFVKPGLTEREYRVLRNYLPFSVLLFVAGAAFGYEFVVKTSLGFFQNVTASSQVRSVWGLQNTLGFALKLSAFTGIVFQLPIASLVLAKADLLDADDMVKYRSYFFIAVLLAAAVATPPDIVSQLLLTAPVIVLYQLSIWLVRRS
jgi:sec-independent protein translocase protein TatC